MISGLNDELIVTAQWIWKMGVFACITAEREGKISLSTSRMFSALRVPLRVQEPGIRPSYQMGER